MTLKKATNYVSLSLSLQTVKWRLGNGFLHRERKPTVGIGASQGSRWWEKHAGSRDKSSCSVLGQTSHQTTYLTYLPQKAGKRQDPRDRFHNGKLGKSPGLRTKTQQRNLAPHPCSLIALDFGHLPKGTSYVVSRPDNPSPSPPCNTWVRIGVIKTGLQAVVEGVCFLGSSWF